MANVTLTDLTASGGAALKIVIDNLALANLPYNFTGSELTTIKAHLTANPRTDISVLVADAAALRAYFKAKNSYPHTSVADERFQGDTEGSEDIAEEMRRRNVFSSLATAVGSFRLSSELIHELSFLIA